MNAGSSVAMLDRGMPTLAERAAAILGDEIANGALANVAAASRMWPAHRRDLITAEATRQLAAEVGGLLDTVLDLVSPPLRSSGHPVAALRRPARPGGRARPAHDRALARPASTALGPTRRGSETSYRPAERGPEPCRDRLRVERTGRRT